MATGFNRQLIERRATNVIGAVPVESSARFAAGTRVARAAFEFALHEHRVALRIVAAQFIVSWFICISAHRPVIVGFSDALITVWGAALIYGVISVAVGLVQRRPDGMPAAQGYSAAWTRLYRERFSASWCASVLLMLVILPISLDVFSAAKRAIPGLSPFSWDVRIDSLGVWMHGGHRPWELLQPILGHPWITVLLDRYYHLGWSCIVLGVQGLVLVAAPSSLRQRYLTASILVWFVVGTVGAFLFASVGPPFYNKVVPGVNPYSQLFAYLDSVNRATPLLARGGQHMLWSAYVHGSDTFGFGISAMPSVHIASITLVACLAFALNRWLGIVATLAAALMFASSISLGWHYAVDGYAGAMMAIALWFVARWMERRYRREREAPLLALLR